MSGIYLSSTRRSTRRLTVARTSSSISSPFSSLIVCSRSCMYMSKPTASMCPLCSPPSRLPAPRISRSSAATRKPPHGTANRADAAQPLLGDRRQRVLRWNQEVRVRPSVGAADAPAELIQLRQPVPIGAIHDHRVGIRDVEAVLDDSGRQQHVELVGYEVDHHALE